MKHFNFSKQKLLAIIFLKEEFLPAKDIITAILTDLIKKTQNKVIDVIPQDINHGSIYAQLHSLAEDRIAEKRRRKNLEYKIAYKYKNLPEVIRHLNVKKILDYTRCISQKDITILKACSSSQKTVLELCVVIGIDTKYVKPYHLDKLNDLGLLEYADYNSYKTTAIGIDFLKALNLISVENSSLLSDQEIGHEIF